MSGPRGNPGTLAGDEPEGRLKTSPPRGQQMTKSFELSTVSSRGTKAGGSMHRDGLAMQALKAQIYRQYTHTGLLFGQLDVILRQITQICLISKRIRVILTRIRVILSRINAI